jgi:hypothetical protein
MGQSVSRLFRLPAPRTISARAGANHHSDWTAAKAVTASGRVIVSINAIPNIAKLAANKIAKYPNMRGSIREDRSITPNGRNKVGGGGHDEI